MSCFVSDIFRNAWKTAFWHKSCQNPQSIYSDLLRLGSDALTSLWHHSSVTSAKPASHSSPTVVCCSTCCMRVCLQETMCLQWLSECSGANAWMFTLQCWSSIATVQMLHSMLHSGFWKILATIWALCSRALLHMNAHHLNKALESFRLDQRPLPFLRLASLSLPTLSLFSLL